MMPRVLISRLQTCFGKCENLQLWGQGTMQMNRVYLLCTLVSTSIQWWEVTSPSESCLQRPNELSHWIIYHGTWHTLSTLPASWCHVHYYYLALSIQCTLCAHSLSTAAVPPPVDNARTGPGIISPCSRASGHHTGLLPELGMLALDATNLH